MRYANLKERDRARSKLKFDRNMEIKSYVSLSQEIIAESDRWIVTLLVCFYEQGHCVNTVLFFSLEKSDFVENSPLFHVVLLVFLYLHSFGRQTRGKTAWCERDFLGGEPPGIVTLF